MAAVTNEADILSGITGAGLVALVYDEVKSCFDVFPSDGEENPALAAGHVELRVRGLEQGSQIPRKKQRDLAKFAGAGLMVLPAAKV